MTISEAFSLPSLFERLRSPSVLKVALLLLHLVFGGVLFLIDDDLVSKAKTEPWYIALYILLFVATMVQYFYTVNSNPGYVIDAMRAVNESTTIHGEASVTSEHQNSSKNGSFVINVDMDDPGVSLVTNPTSWEKLVQGKHPPGTVARMLICYYCNVEQPPRTKHCHDCDKCVLQFDHHCVWLGTCIGHGNHCRFWWYVFEELALCLWTEVLYISYLIVNVARVWWKSAIMISLVIILSLFLLFLVLLMLFHCYLILTNQTTYELVRRKRISYFRGIPNGTHPFSKGICRNLYNFCCSGTSIYTTMEAVPSQLELEEKSRPYTCTDVFTCRCC